MLVLLLVLVVLLCFIHFLFNYNGTAKVFKQLPGPKDYFIFGNMPVILVSPVELFKVGRFYANKFVGIYRFWAFPIGSLNVYNPEDIEILTATMAHSEKSYVYKFLKPWLQDGLLLSKGQKWQERRKILTPTFHFNILSQFCVTLEENSQCLIETLSQSNGEAVDIVPLLSEYTLSSICETAMGTQLDNRSGAGNSYKKAIHELGKLLVDRFIKIYYFSDFIFQFSSIARNQIKYLDLLHSFTGRVIKEKKKEIDKHGGDMAKVVDEFDDINVGGRKKRAAMLDVLISAEKEGLIDDAGIQEEVDTFMFEGHDTTATGLMYCLLLLANHKHVQDRIVEELYEIFGESSRPACIADLSRMRYLERCIKESMRLYPPVPFISRNITETVVLSNKYTVPPGTICHIHIYDLHRRGDIFQDPLVFDPDRFLPQNSTKRHPYSYIPFSAGPRNCIGQKFAILEMKSCISNILRKFHLIPVTREADLQFKSDLVLRNTKPIYVKFVEKYQLDQHT